MMTQGAQAVRRIANKRNEASTKKEQKNTFTTQTISYDYKPVSNREEKWVPPCRRNLPAPETIPENQSKIGVESDAHLNNKSDSLPKKEELVINQINLQENIKKQKEREEVTQKQTQEKNSLPSTNKNKNNKCCLIY
jgi:hypothetical protein